MAGITTPDKFPFLHHPKHEIVKSLTCDGYIHAVAKNPGDIIYSQNGITLSDLPIGQVGQILAVGAGEQPEWTNAIPIGVGNVNGPNGATDNAAVRYDQTSGRFVKNSVVTIADNGNVGGVNNLNVVTINNQVPTVGDLVGPAGATGNAVVRFDQATGKLVKDSPVTIADNGNITGVNNLVTTTVNGVTIPSVLEGTHLTNWTGPWTTRAGNVSWVKKGKSVTLQFPEIRGVYNQAQGIAFLDMLTVLPVDLRPAWDVLQTGVFTSNRPDIQLNGWGRGSIKVQADGNVRIYPSEPDDLSQAFWDDGVFFTIPIGLYPTTISYVTA